MIQSSHCEIVTEKQMDYGNIPAGVHHIKSIKLRVLVLDAVFFQSLLHVQRPSQAFPYVACPVLIILQIPVQDLPDSLFSRHLQYGAMVIYHIHYLYSFRFFCQFAYDVLGVFPPLYLTFRVHVQVLAPWTIELSLSSLTVDLDSWFATGAIEPVGDIGSCRLDEGSGAGVTDILLYDFGKVVDFSEEGDPAVIGTVVVCNLLDGEISLWLSRHWQELLDVIRLRLAHQLYNYQGQSKSLAFRNRIQMKINTPAKIAPSLFTHDEPEECFSEERAPPPFREVNNTVSHRYHRKKEHKNKPQKSFISKSDEENEENQTNTPQPERVPQHTAQQVPEVQGSNHEYFKLKEKPQLLLDLDLEEEVQIASPVPVYEQLKRNQSEQEPTQSFIRNIDKIKNLDLSASSQPEGENSAKIIEQSTPKKQETLQEPPSVNSLQMHDYTLNSEYLFQKIPPKTTLRCLIRRDKKNHQGVTQYNVYFQSNLRHILTVKKESMCQHAFYLRQSKGYSFTYTKVAVLQSNFISSKYTLFKPEETNSQLTVCYQTNFLGFNGPRKLHIYLPKGIVPYEYLSDAYEKKKWQESIEKCVSKSARWSEKARSFILSFKGRALKSSIKNFVITDEKESEDKYWIIFGKAAPDVFNLDIQSPFSLIQGVGVAISSFERKLTCD